MTLIQLTVNGTSHEVDVEPTASLAEVLRDSLALTGTKITCNVGVCGVCSVLVNGQLMSSCLVMAGQTDGKSVTTVEGLAHNGELTPVQQSFINEGGFQCGICTSGQVVSASALLQQTPKPSDEEIREWMTGNLCRCTGYYQIIRAVRAAANV